MRGEIKLIGELVSINTGTGLEWDDFCDEVFVHGTKFGYTALGFFMGREQGSVLSFDDRTC